MYRWGPGRARRGNETLRLYHFLFFSSAHSLGSLHFTSLLPSLLLSLPFVLLSLCACLESPTPHGRRETFGAYNTSRLVCYELRGLDSDVHGWA